jgi:vacuolar-type H+-ATPase subunit I/STV1
MGRVKSSTPLSRILTFARLFAGLTSAARIQRMFNSFTKEEREIFFAGDKKFLKLDLGR